MWEQYIRRNDIYTTSQINKYYSVSTCKEEEF